VHTLSRCKNPPSTTQLRPMAVRVVHKLQRYTLSVARLTAPKPHTSGAVRLANPHAKQAVAQCRAVQSVVPRPRRRAHCRAPLVTRRMQRPLVVQVQPLEGRTDLALPPHTPVPVPALRSTSAACVHVAPSRVPTQRSTPDAGENAHNQPALYSADSHAPQVRSTAPYPGAAASAGRGASQGRSQARSSAAQRAAARGTRAWARWPRAVCWRRF